jgi:hypothetical protein
MHIQNYAGAAVRPARPLKPIREGFRAKHVVLTSESQQDFSELCDDLEDEWQPQTRTEQFMVEQMAVSQWKLTRLEIGEVSLYTQELDGRAQLPLICKISALQSRLERSYFQAMRQLEHLQTSRRLRAAQQEKAARSAAAEAPSDQPRRESSAWQAPKSTPAPAPMLVSRT